MQPKDQNAHFADLRHVFPLLRMTRVRVRFAQTGQLRCLDQVQRRGGKGGHVTDHGECHRAQIFQQIDVTQHPSMCLTRPELDKMAVQL